MPDPDSETGVAKWYRLTSRLAAVEASAAAEPVAAPAPAGRTAAELLAEAMATIANDETLDAALEPNAAAMGEHSVGKLLGNCTNAARWQGGVAIDEHAQHELEEDGALLL